MAVGPMMSRAAFNGAVRLEPAWPDSLHRNNSLSQQ
jgi:hypothetical protein